MIRAVGAAVAGIVTLVGALMLTLLVGFGVPKPPTVTIENVGRVSWTPVLRDLDLTLRTSRSASLAAWMPDGQGVLVRARRWILDSRLYRLSEPGGDLELLRHIPRNVQAVAAQPGRSYVVFSWDQDGAEQFQLYRWDLDDSTPTRLTNGEERAAFGAFEPDGPRMAFVSNRRNGTDWDVYVVDPLEPRSEQMVLQASGAWRVLDWSPASEELLLARVTSNVANELFVLDVATGTTAPLLDDEAGPVAHGSVQYTDDGNGLYYVSDRDSEFKHLRHLDLRTGEETVLTDEIPWDVEGVRESGDGAFLLLGVNEDGVGRSYLYDVARDAPRPLDLFPSGLTSVALHPTGSVLIVNHVDASGVSRGYQYDLETERLTLWAGSPGGESRVPSGELVRYPTFDEVDGHPREISAFVYPGVGSGPRPVLIDIHGGPEAQARLSTRYLRTQRAGITVITPNVRGSTGYGKSFTRLDDGYLREDAVKDIGALLDWIATRPELDQSRIGVTGGSYGGYMVLASLVHFGDRIRCGVDVVGVSNFVTFLENTAAYRRDLRRAEYGDERDPDMRRFLESISPLNNAQRITSPLLVVQGANDPRVPVGESRQMVERVRTNQQTVGYIEAADEGHGFRKPWNALYAGTAQTQMLERCLNP